MLPATPPLLCVADGTMSKSFGLMRCGPRAPGRSTGIRCSVWVFVALDQPVAILLRERFVTFRVVHLTTVVSLRSAGFDLLPTGLRPHFTVRLERGDDAELADLYRALGPERDNPGYGWTTTGRKEG